LALGASPPPARAVTLIMARAVTLIMLAVALVLILAALWL
jgi:hypothetical protein